MEREHFLDAILQHDHQLQPQLIVLTPPVLLLDTGHEFPLCVYLEIVFLPTEPPTQLTGSFPEIVVVNVSTLVHQRLELKLDQKVGRFQFGLGLVKAVAPFVDAALDRLIW